MIKFSHKIWNFRHLLMLKRLESVQNYCLSQKRTFLVSQILKDSFTVQDENDFKGKVLQSNTPVIVDFQATWCGPCKTLGPRLESIIATKGDKVHLAKVDIDDNSDLAIEYGVTAVPAVFGIKNGKVMDKFVGVLDDDQINSFVDKLIGPV